MMSRQIAVLVALLAIVAHVRAAEHPAWILVTVTGSQELRVEPYPSLKILAQGDVLEHDSARRLIRSTEIGAVYEEDGETIIATDAWDVRTLYWIQEPIEAICALLNCGDAATVQRNE